MQILNLTNVEKSDIKYTISHFPDGEVQITLGEFSRKDEIEVKCRITSAEELFILMQVADILRRHGMRFSISIYYLMGMRMDRVMDFNRPFTLKMVVDILDSLCATSIAIFCPHSKVTTQLFRKTEVVPLNPVEWMDEEKHFWDVYQVVLPDAGAAERYFDGNVPFDIIIGEKVRDVETGKILSIKVKNPEAIDGGWPLIMIDDLCDGGGTFVGLANAIREVEPDIEINIAVNHMVNPKGIENLSRNFDHVRFTNSYKDWKETLGESFPKNVTQIDVI